MADRVFVQNPNLPTNWYLANFNKWIVELYEFDIHGVKMSRFIEPLSCSTFGPKAQHAWFVILNRLSLFNLWASVNKNILIFFQRMSNLFNQYQQIPFKNGDDRDPFSGSFKQMKYCSRAILTTLTLFDVVVFFLEKNRTR